MPSTVPSKEVRGIRKQSKNLSFLCSLMLEKNLAVASGSKYIVTYNLKDFKNIQSFGIEAVPPKKFLEILEEA